MYRNNNIFFFINNFIFIHINTLNYEHKYSIELINNNLYIFIKNKDINKKDYLKITIFIGNRKCILELENQESNVVNIGNIYKLNYVNYIENNLETIIIYVKKNYPSFDFNFYIQNNNYLNIEINKNDLIYLNNINTDNTEYIFNDLISNTKYNYAIDNNLNIEMFEEFFTDNKLKYVYYHWIHNHKIIVS